VDCVPGSGNWPRTGAAAPSVNINIPNTNGLQTLPTSLASC
jgi:hypothetical protein